ncbi:autotransporter outer membrane beta-barrel domain-containing protein [Luteolibacter luteus]|uniref:Autotransporter outer membrane beta-barrel domain-containing protein n=1 Tax=Luteolibacter luteus TaxID=2728835 RepID=A0A858RR29_9BACT|nr:autotransporter outer membrane beta-barrel domain-containing protein [Luteolibacter luteus]QJE98383.1 autotransporter outer membrane beta-barrel domain-containing protein [Luteolibacter luteus]
MNTPTVSFMRVLAIAAVTCSTSVQAGDESEDPCYPDNRQATSTAVSRSVLGVAYASTRDVSGRMYRNRAGVRPGSVLVDEPVAVAPAYSSKGGMSSSKDAKVSAVSVPYPNKWEVFGSLFYYSEESDGSSYHHRSKKKKYEGPKYGYGSGYGSGASAFVSGAADTSLDVYGGALGVEYHINREWSVGVGVSASTGDMEMDAVGNADVDSVSVIPYLSYYRADAFGSADFWAGLMYAYGAHSFETRRFTGGGIASGSPDADTHEVEFTAGVNFGDDDVVHGPYAGMRYITGTVDAYTEVGPGATYFGEQDVDSLVSILGYQISWKMRGSRGTWVPQVRAAWEHEFEDGNASVFGVPVDSVDEDVAVVGAGLAYYFDNGWNLGVEYEGRFGSNTEGHYGGVKAGKEF